MTKAKGNPKIAVTHLHHGPEIAVTRHDFLSWPPADGFSRVVQMLTSALSSITQVRHFRAKQSLRSMHCHRSEYLFGLHSSRRLLSGDQARIEHRIYLHPCLSAESNVRRVWLSGGVMMTKSSTRVHRVSIERRRPARSVRTRSASSMVR